MSVCAHAFVCVCVSENGGEFPDSEALYQWPNCGVPAGEALQLLLLKTHTHIHAPGSSPGLCSRMLHSPKMLVNRETARVECFVSLSFRGEELTQCSLCVSLDTVVPLIFLLKLRSKTPKSC